MREAFLDTTFTDAFGGVAPDMPEELRSWYGITAALKCMIGVGAIQGAIFGCQSPEVKAVTERWMSQEAIHEWLSGPMGLMLQLLAMKWGLV